MSDREQQVLAAMRRARFAGRPASIARVLNFDAPCEWCPVGTPREGEQCATVPLSSRRAVESVLKSLVRAGHVEQLYRRTRMMMYVEKGTL